MVLVSLGLLIILATVAGVAARTSYFVGRAKIASKPAALTGMSPASPPTGSLTLVKEYIYGPGGRILATEEPQGSSPVNPVPNISSLSPSTVIAGTGPITLRVNGTGFVQGVDAAHSSVINVDGSPRTTTFNTYTGCIPYLTTTLSAGDVASATVRDITVSNPSPGGGTSNKLKLTVQDTGTPGNPVPQIDSASPSSLPVG